MGAFGGNYGSNYTRGSIIIPTRSPYTLQADLCVKKNIKTILCVAGEQLADIFALNFLGAEWEVKLVDCMNDMNFDISDVIDQQIIFYKPDGTRLEKQAQLIEDPNDPNNHFITFVNTAPDTKSILDLVGKWEFSGMVQLSSNDSFQASQRSIFWVS